MPRIAVALLLVVAAALLILWLTAQERPDPAPAAPDSTLPAAAPTGRRGAAPAEGPPPERGGESALDVPSEAGDEVLAGVVVDESGKGIVVPQRGEKPVLRIEATGSLLVTAHDEQGKPVVGAWVWASLERGGVSGSTDGKGACRLDGIQVGRWSLSMGGRGPCLTRNTRMKEQRPMDGVNIRECRVEELDRAHELIADDDEDAQFYDEDYSPEAMRRRLCEYFLVAEVEGRLVGAVVAEHQTIEFMQSEVGRCAFADEKEYLEVQDLYVEPEFRGRGIGKKLMMEVLQRGRRNGLQRSMVYSSNEDYVQIARFYEGCGYRMWHIFMTQ